MGIMELSIKGNNKMELKRILIRFGIRAGIIRARKRDINDLIIQNGKNKYSSFTNNYEEKRYIL